MYRLMNVRAVNILLSLLLFLTFGGLRASAAEPHFTEYQLKAAFVYNFAKFVEWPTQTFPSPDAPITIGVVCERDKEFADALEQTINNKRINGRRLAISHIRSLQDLKGCHIVFICRSEKKLPVAEVLQAVKGQSVLTVGETDTFMQSGGIINFMMEGDKVQFEIDNASAKRAGLQISSKLLALAKRRGGGT
ncbi:MAG: hypothetical protein JWQ71_338 [Pedosphaera sp.]|nr:hypothetical protein [Pedosphaera sp.]